MVVEWRRTVEEEVRKTGVARGVDTAFQLILPFRLGTAGSGS
jgi:hypothetical protein